MFLNFPNSVKKLYRIILTAKYFFKKTITDALQPISACNYNQLKAVQLNSNNDETLLIGALYFAFMTVKKVLLTDALSFVLRVTRQVTVNNWQVACTWFLFWLDRCNQQAESFSKLAQNNGHWRTLSSCFWSQCSDNWADSQLKKLIPFLSALKRKKKLVTGKPRDFELTESADWKRIQWKLSSNWMSKAIPILKSPTTGDLLACLLALPPNYYTSPNLLPSHHRSNFEHWYFWCKLCASSLCCCRRSATTRHCLHDPCHMVNDLY